VDASNAAVKASMTVEACMDAADVTASSGVSAAVAA
jgi:hypothetical protein